MQTWMALLAALALVGCRTAPEGGLATAASAAPVETTSSYLTPEQVIAWADFPRNLARPRRLIIAQADGRGSLGEYVTLLNGAAAKRFLTRHGYAKTLRILAVRRTPSTIQVDVEIEGKDGAKATLTLYADGHPQGIG